MHMPRHTGHFNRSSNRKVAAPPPAGARELRCSAITGPDGRLDLLRAGLDAVTGVSAARTDAVSHSLPTPAQLLWPDQ